MQGPRASLPRGVLMTCPGFITLITTKTREGNEGLGRSSSHDLPP